MSSGGRCVRMLLSVTRHAAFSMWMDKPPKRPKQRLRAKISRPLMRAAVLAGNEVRVRISLTASSSSRSRSGLLPARMTPTLASEKSRREPMGLRKGREGRKRFQGPPQDVEDALDAFDRARGEEVHFDDAEVVVEMGRA